MLLAFLLALPVQAEATPPRQPPREEDVVTIVQAILPHAIGAFAAKCQTLLPPDAYLRRDGERLAGRMQPLADIAWPRASPLLARLAAARFTPGASDADKKTQLFASFDQKVVRDMSAPDCEAVSGLLEPLDPLPPQNLTLLLSRLVETFFFGTRGATLSSPMH
ncbi:hypothetical protein [Sphingomonas sp.]|uniref:hypothetical protein n=1 Tax=Sphingomonas sp. TaxID=28214 RepID=UPI003B00BF06